MIPKMKRTCLEWSRRISREESTYRRCLTLNRKRFKTRFPQALHERSSDSRNRHWWLLHVSSQTTEGRRRRRRNDHWKNHFNRTHQKPIKESFRSIIKNWSVFVLAFPSCKFTTVASASSLDSVDPTRRRAPKWCIQNNLIFKISFNYDVLNISKFPILPSIPTFKIIWKIPRVWRLLDESPISTNLGNDHRFIIKEYYLHKYEAFWGSPNQSHQILYSKRTISYDCGESCSFNMVSELRGGGGWKSHNG